MANTQSSKLESLNPATEEVVARYEYLSTAELDQRLSLAESAFLNWKSVAVAEKAGLFKRLAATIRLKHSECAAVISIEMGKPISAAKAEVEKCAALCLFYAENADTYLSPKMRESDASKSYLRYDPIGCIFGIVPWNYPFWQVFRFCLPSLAVGNVCLIKHAPNVCGTARLIADLFIESGFPLGVLQVLFIDHDLAAAVIRDQRVAALSLTGSERAGKLVAAIAGSVLKKCVLELGGSDAFIVLSDADLEVAASSAVAGRTSNAGQICIAPKRFIIESAVADEFEKLVVSKIAKIKVGDPMLSETQMGPLARRDVLESVALQVNQTIRDGAKLLVGGEKIGKKGFFYQPTVLTDVSAGSVAFQEEIFGPVVSIAKVSGSEEAIALANNSRYGLAAGIWTKDTERAEQLAEQIHTGMVFINGLPKSDPRLPFGGVKCSGYGRELSVEGIQEFANVKTVWVR